jgi:tRNA (mo5U34)-methyltransferase
VTTVKDRVEAEPYWFLRIDLGDGVVTPGWSDPSRDKLPYFGLPADMTGLRVLDVGCAEGFFSFEAERRGAAEVVSIDFDPECIKRFGICADALGSKLTAQVGGIYDLDPSVHGTFDLVMFFGLLYHLPNPLLGIEKVAAVTSGTLLVQSYTLEVNALPDVAMARFRPDGLWSGPKENLIHDPTVYWEPNAACIRDVERLHEVKPSTRERVLRRLRSASHATWNSSAQFRADVPIKSLGAPPDD